jgi:integrase/recombinase XerD
MASNISDRRVSPLRARMVEDMTVRGFTEKTRQDYVRHVQAFAAFIGRSPATATPDDIRGFQLHQRQSGMQPPSINTAVSALRFLFTMTLDRPDLARHLTIVRQPRRLPSVLSVEEVALLLQAAPGPKYKAAFATAYGAGLRVSEVVTLKVGDIDSERMLLRIEQGKGRKDRHAMLSPQLLEQLRAWCIAAGRLAVSRPQSSRTAIDPTAQPRRSRRGRGCRDQEAGVAAYIAAQLRHAPAGTGHGYPCDPGAARPCQARHHGPLHPRRQHHDPQRHQPARPARAVDQRQATSPSIAGAPCAARGWRSQTSSTVTAPPGAKLMPGM